MMIKSRKKT